MLSWFMGDLFHRLLVCFIQSCTQIGCFFIVNTSVHLSFRVVVPFRNSFFNAISLLHLVGHLFLLLQKLNQQTTGRDVRLNLRILFHQEMLS